MTDLLHSPLHDRHVALGAKLADFGGWEMPIEYAASGGGVLKEHAAVREAVGIFDVSHLGKATVQRRRARASSSTPACPTTSAASCPARRSTRCAATQSGGVVDDLIAYLVSDDEVFLVPNAANTAEVVRRLAAAAPERRRRSPTSIASFGVIAVQGPRSADVLGTLGLPAELDYMAYVDATFDGRAGAGVPHRLHRRARVRADPVVGRHARAVGCAGLGGGVLRRAAGRARRARHAAHRGGVPAARPGPLARHHARPGPLRRGRSAGRRTSSGDGTP